MSESPSPGVVAELQRAVLRAVLSRAPLPGGTDPVAFPDLQFVAAQGRALVLDENFASDAGTDLPVQVVSRQELAREAGERGQVGYLHFRPPSVHGGEVRLTLQAALATGEPDQRQTGLSGMQFVMREEGGRWVGSPVAAIAM